MLLIPAPSYSPRKPRGFRASRGVMAERRSREGERCESWAAAMATSWDVAKSIKHQQHRRRAGSDRGGVGTASRFVM